MPDPTSTEENVKNTLLHEIAHALAGHEHNHDEVWKATARSIGCDGCRCGHWQQTTLTPRWARKSPLLRAAPKPPPPPASPLLRARTHARTNETKRFPGWGHMRAHPPSLQYICVGGGWVEGVLQTFRFPTSPVPAPRLGRRICPPPFWWNGFWRGPGVAASLIRWTWQRVLTSGKFDASFTLSTRVAFRRSRIHDCFVFT